MRVAIVGVGAIGGWLAAAASRGGAQVSALARGATLSALADHGLTVLDNDGQTSYSVAAHSDPRALGEQDLVVVAVKAPSLPAVVGQLHPMMGPDTRVLFAMNGVPWWFLEGGFGGAFTGHALASVDPGGTLHGQIPAERILGGVVHAGCSIEKPGVIRHHNGYQLIVGPVVASTPVADVAELLVRGGLEVPVSDCIQRDIWFKLWGNMTVNPMTMLGGVTIDKLMDDDLAVAFMSSIMLEAKEIGARLGIQIVDEPADRHVFTRRLGAFRSSMLQDLDAHRPVELDALLGAVLELGRLTGVPTPFGDALFAMARLRAREAGIY